MAFCIFRARNKSLILGWIKEKTDSNKRLLSCQAKQKLLIRRLRSPSSWHRVLPSTTCVVTCSNLYIRRVPIWPQTDQSEASPYVSLKSRLWRRKSAKDLCVILAWVYSSYRLKCIMCVRTQVIWLKQQVCISDGSSRRERLLSINKSQMTAFSLTWHCVRVMRLRLF